MHLTDMKYLLFALMGLLFVQCATTKNEVQELPYSCIDQNKVEIRELPPFYVNTYEFSDTNNLKLTLHLDTVVYSGDTTLFGDLLEKIKYPDFCTELLGGGSTGYFFTFLLDENDQITNVELVRKGGCDKEMVDLVQRILEKTQFIHPSYDVSKVIMRIVVRNKND